MIKSRKSDELAYLSLLSCFLNSFSDASVFDVYFQLMIFDLCSIRYVSSHILNENNVSCIQYYKYNKKQ